MRAIPLMFISVAVAVAVAVLARPSADAAETRPARRYADHARLMVYLDDQGRERPVATADDWARRRRADILAGMQEAMGMLPDRRNLPPPDARVTDPVAGDDGVTRLSVSLAADDGGGDRVPAYLLLPARPGPPGTRHPAVLALHQTTVHGKAEPAGLGGNPDLAYGRELARRGYVVLCPDYPSFGDYRYDFRAAFVTGRYASGSMKGVFNHMRCVDYLRSRPDVDPARVGAIGHSLGGHNAMFLAALDDRVAAVVSSCGWTPFPEYYGGRIAGWTGDVYMPRLRDAYRLEARAVPFDFPEVVAALAPRPFFSSSPERDANFAVAGVRRAEAAARPVYELLGAAGALRVRYPDCDHAFPPGVREEAYAFLDAALRPGRAGGGGATAQTRPAATQQVGPLPGSSPP